MTPSVVVFDIGNVLVDWQPHLAWSDELNALLYFTETEDRVGMLQFN